MTSTPFPIDELTSAIDTINDLLKDLETTLKSVGTEVEKNALPDDERANIHKKHLEIVNQTDEINDFLEGLKDANASIFEEGELKFAHQRMSRLNIVLENILKLTLSPFERMLAEQQAQVNFISSQTHEIKH